MSLDKDSNIFDETSFADISKNIYKSSKRRSALTNSIIKDLTSLIKTPSDATFVVPLLKELLDTDIKNSDIEIRLATVIQKLISTSTKALSDNGDNLFTDLELKELEDIKLELGESLGEFEEAEKQAESQINKINKNKVELEMRKLDG